MMTGRTRLLRGVLAAALVTAFAGIAGCRSAHIEVTVENRTGAEVKLIEVDYPSASFGVGSLSAGEDYHYRIQVRGSGPLKVQYVGAGGHREQMTGPTLVEHQQGQLTITLLPGGKAEFRPELAGGR